MGRLVWQYSLIELFSFSNLTTISGEPLPTLFTQFILERALGSGVSIMNDIYSGGDFPSMNVFSDSALAVGAVRDAYVSIALSSK